MQTELLTLIFEEAKKQCESKNDSVGLGLCTVQSFQ